jgi:2'-5' RNA ligase
MSNLVIVAIPSEDDYVWKISSEKVPHMTILFLGEVTEVPYVTKIVEFVEHAVKTSVNRFGLEVDHRGTLGIDQADVLFFDMKWSEWLIDWRAQLLKDNNIFKAYNSVAQFPEWNPHLTLGYPESPAKEDTREYPGIHWVNFDKIAVWYGDYVGPEFQLTDKDYYPMEVMMSTTAEKAAAGADRVAELLHFGVKGMKWGVRKERTSDNGEVSVETKVRRHGKTAIKTSGGREAEAHPDAIAAKVARQKVKKSGVNSLSNAELQQLIQRMNMEQQLGRLQGPNDFKKAVQFVDKSLNSTEGKLAISAVKTGVKLGAQTELGQQYVSTMTKAMGPTGSILLSSLKKK